MYPKISIITICYNAQQFIGETFASVRTQSTKDFEYIVIDGGSTDGTVAMIERNLDIIDHWISEPDQGIADAMNKGVGMARGSYILFLNADDYFVDEDSVARAIGALSRDKDILVFESFLLTKEGRTLNRARKLNFLTQFKLPFCHQGVLCKRTLFDKIGGFDPEFRITMDYDFFLRAYRANTSCELVAKPLSIFRDTGISSRTDLAGLAERFDEEKKVHYKNCPSLGFRLFYFIWWVLYLPYKRMIVKGKQRSE